MENVLLKEFIKQIRSMIRELYFNNKVQMLISEQET
jgi:hypothetical protein